MPAQDFFERLKIQSVPSGGGDTIFAVAIGDYVINGDRVTFCPRLPIKPDRSDAGLRANASYVVQVKGGPDALQSATGSPATNQQFLFETNEYFEDFVPNDPPRALGFAAISTGQPVDLSRLTPVPDDLAALDNSELIAAGHVIEPAPPGLPDGTPWQFDLSISEPLDPETVTTDNVEMLEIFGDATTSGPTDPNVVAPPGHFGTPVNFKVPIRVEPVQGVDHSGGLNVVLRVTVLGILVDNTRYRITFSGNILGLDFRKMFIGENGLTGDGLVIDEPGGIGYTTEFIVRDVPTTQATRVLTFDPAVDGIKPETGQTTEDEAMFNAAVYNSPLNPGVAVGFVGAFGGGVLGDLVVEAGTTYTINTGDEYNELAGVTITVTDLDPADAYKNTPGLPAPGIRTHEAVEPTEYDFASIQVGTSATLKVIGVNPCRLLSSGLVQINGTIDAAGGPGGNGIINQPSLGTDAAAGTAGPGGFAGGLAKSGIKGTQYCFSGCQNFDAWVNAAGGRPTAFPKSMKGEGPGRGHNGGEASVVYQQDAASVGTPTGTGGGGGGHATEGEFGEDRANPSGQLGAIGKCSQWSIANSSLIGLRGAPGPAYGDREALDFTGGSGGGAGGAIQGFNNGNSATGSGGGGGGGGGFLEILSAGPINVTGLIDVSGGAGGRGFLLKHVTNAWTAVSGSGGGGSGGTVSLVSGTEIDLTNGMLDARGGIGGARPFSSSYSGSCAGCNAGGAGSKGYIFLMDADGVIFGINPGPSVPGEPGNHDDFATGMLTIRGFDPVRFGGVNMVTELYSVRVANPTYLPISNTEIIGKASGGQVMTIKVSSAKPNPENPLLPNLTTELPLFEIAQIYAVGAGIVVEVTGDIRALNPSGLPARDAFMRVVAEFDYDDPREAALGPFMEIDEVVTTFTFN